MKENNLPNLFATIVIDSSTPESRAFVTHLKVSFQ